jgi:tripartite-type tricarboxylate transporter receptor subunit TctC
MFSRAFALAAALLVAHAAPAQTFPTKPVRLIVTGSPGSSGDTLGRMVAEGLTQAFGRQVILDNRPGAGANIGPEIAARAPADGYTLFIVTISHAVNATLYRKLAYDIVRDFAPVTQLVTDPAALVVHSTVAARSVAELIALAKAKPGALNYASGGTGTFTFLAAELFKGQAGVDIVHVPYKGGGPALLAVVGGEVAVYFAPLGISLPHVRQGRLRALGVTTLKRVPLVPELPTVADAGLPGFEAGNWFGVLAPAATPKPVIGTIHDATVKWLNAPASARLLDDLAYVRIGNTPDAFAAHIKAEIARLGKIVRALKLSAD